MNSKSTPILGQHPGPLPTYHLPQNSPPHSLSSFLMPPFHQLAKCAALLDCAVNGVAFLLQEWVQSLIVLLGLQLSMENQVAVVARGAFIWVTPRLEHCVLEHSGTFVLKLTGAFYKERLGAQSCWTRWATSFNVLVSAHRHPRISASGLGPTRAVAKLSWRKSIFGRTAGRREGGSGCRWGQGNVLFCKDKFLPNPHSFLASSLGKKPCTKPQNK